MAGVKNATEEENEAVLGKKEAASVAAGGCIYGTGGRSRVREGLRAAQRSAAVKQLTAGIIFVASRKWSDGERDGDAATGNRKAEPPTDCRQFRYYSFCSRSPVSHTRETPRTRAKMASS